MNLALALCVIYLVISLLAGLAPRSRAPRTVSGFVAGDGHLGPVLLYFVLSAAIFSSAAFLGITSWAYTRGAAVYYIICFGSLGIIPYYFLGIRARSIGSKLGLITQAGLVSRRFDSRLISVLMACLSVVVFIPYLTLQMKGAGLVFSIVSDGVMPFWAGAGLTYAVVVVYVLVSGVLGVGWTNALQGIFMMVIAWFLGLYLPSVLHGGIGPMFDQLIEGGHANMLVAPGLGADGQPWAWTEFGSWILVSAIGFSCWPHLFMKCFASKGSAGIRFPVIVYPTFSIFLVPLMFIGFAAVLAFPNVEPSDQILPHMLTQVGLPTAVVGIAAVGILAASMSSGDTILHAAASITIHDGVKVADAGSDWVERHERKLIVGLVVVIAAVAYYFAVASSVPIISLLAGAYGGVAQIMPALVATQYWRGASGLGVLSGLVAGIAVNVLFLLNPEFKPVAMHEGVYGLAANVSVLVLVSFLRPDVRSAEIFDEFEQLRAAA